MKKTELGLVLMVLIVALAIFGIGYDLGEVRGGPVVYHLSITCQPARVEMPPNNPPIVTYTCEGK